MIIKKTFRIALSLVILLFAFAFDHQILAQGSSNAYVANEVIVKLNSTANLPVIAGQYGLDAQPLSQFGNRPIYRLRVLNNASIPQIITQLQSDTANVAYAEPNYLIGSPNSGSFPWTLGGSWSIGGSWRIGGSVKGYSIQWMKKKIDLAAAHQVTRGQGIKIAVLDTGIDLNHPLFAGKLLPGYDFVDNDNDPSEVGTYYQGAYGHGTHVAGIVTMVAPEAKIIPIRVLDQNGAGNVWSLAEGLSYAANPDGDISTDDGANVINLSLGTNERTRLIRLLIAAETNYGQNPDDDDFPNISHPGIAVIAAAGNTGNTMRIYPAAEDVDGLVAVGASTKTDTVTTFSTYGNSIEIMAPGEKIVSSIPGGRYATWRGTSMSAPIVSGITALVMARYPKLNSKDAIDRIRNTSVIVNASINRRVDAGRAVTLPQD